ncbi:MAG: hypothetical protein K6G00_06000, partial [Treponema sp.]|nr:hypothetical protein [Treponema sp.]
MILSILFMFLMIISASAVFCFLFFLFLPSLKNQNINTSNPLLSKDEFTEDKELLVSIPEINAENNELVQDDGENDSQFLQMYGDVYNLKKNASKLSLRNEKVFQFWSKWYTMF